MSEVSAEVEARVERIHAEKLVVDMCWTTNPALPTSSFDGLSSLDRAIAGGIAGACNTVSFEHHTFRQALEELNKVRLLEQIAPTKFTIVYDTSDIEDAKRDGKLGSIVHFQTGSPVEDDWPNTLPVLHKLGLRVMQVTYNETNLLGSGCMEPHDLGLTGYGVQVVKAMNAMGILVDLSHVGRQTSMDTLRVSRDPVLFSHCNADALTPHPRNITDEEIRALRDNGGVIGVVSWDPICARTPGVQSTLDDFLAHMDYLIDLAGPDHVGIGTDINENFSAMPIPSMYEIQYGQVSAEALVANRAKKRVIGFERLEDVRNVTRGMIARGYSDEDIAKVLGGNFMRVAAAVWR
jgi:membrane dipeptidase